MVSVGSEGSMLQLISTPSARGWKDSIGLRKFSLVRFAKALSVASPLSRCFRDFIILSLPIEALEIPLNFLTSFHHLAGEHSFKCCTW